MVQGNVFVLDGVADCIFTDVEVTEVFSRGSFGPINTPLVIIEHKGGWLDSGRDKLESMW